MSADDKVSTRGKGVEIPQPDFSSFIITLSTAALINMGEIENPQTGGREKELPMARHAIDTIAMLKEKTSGNLTEAESRLIEGALADLRMAYLKNSA